MFLYIKKKLYIEGEGEGDGEENLVKIRKGKENDWTSMSSSASSSPLIASYLVLHILPLF